MCALCGGSVHEDYMGISIGTQPPAGRYGAHPEASLFCHGESAEASGMSGA